MKNRRKKIVRIILLCIGVLFVFVTFNTYEVIRYSKTYVDRPADVAIVLGAGQANGKISQVFVERINHGMTLYREGVVPKIILTGGYGEGQKISDSQAAKDYAVLKGIPEKDILIEEKSTITFENLKEAEVIMDAHSMDSALIVSDPYHMKRAMAICGVLDMNAQPSPTPTTAYRTWKKKLKLLMYESFFYNARLLLGPFYT
jgi:uncharacterized SAM-binding protein YcdF (DUF218 family)